MFIVVYSISMESFRTVISVVGVLATLLVQGCAKPVAVSITNNDYWSISRTIDTQNGVITLFDPADLAHHAADPSDWYLYDFAFANDLETGRFVAVLTDNHGRFNIKVTSSPLSDGEQLAAGAHAQLRLRVVNNRLLLTGGDAWPSAENKVKIDQHDRRWIPVANGDYRVRITVLDKRFHALHDYVIQLDPIAQITDVRYAPGIPQLVVGESAAVAGIGAQGLKYIERCATVPRKVEWLPLNSLQIPLPGAVQKIVIPPGLYRRAIAIKEAGQKPKLPVVIANNPREGEIGVYFEMLRWIEHAGTEVNKFAAFGRAYCAVRVTGVHPGERNFILEVDPLPLAAEPLPPDLSRKLAKKFDVWIRLSNDPGWRFKSEMVKRAHDDRSMTLGIMHYLALPAKVTNTLLLASNEERAHKLLERLQIKDSLQ